MKWGERLYYVLAAVSVLLVLWAAVMYAATR